MTSAAPCWQGVIIKSVVLERRPIPASYFAERITGVDLPASKRIHEQLRAIGALDDQDYIEWTRWFVTPPPSRTQCFLPLHAHVFQVERREQCLRRTFCTPWDGQARNTTNKASGCSSCPGSCNSGPFCGLRT